MATANAPEVSASDAAPPATHLDHPAQWAGGGSGLTHSAPADGNRLIATVCAVGGGMLHVVQVALDAARGRYDY